MPSLKERYQNPVVGDTVRLRLFFYNSNNFADVDSIEKVEIYKVAEGASINDASARVLCTTILGTSVVKTETGQYYLDVETTDPCFTIGNYVDVWTVNFTGNIDDSDVVTNPFTLYPNLWYTTPIPVVYDFGFAFRPSKIRKGSKRYIMIEVSPNVPKGTDLQRYYENLAIVGNIKISMEQRTGACLPEEQDLRLILDKIDVTFREKKYGYYMLDTSELEVGIYDVWFQLDIGENIYISEKYQLQIFD